MSCITEILKLKGNKEVLLDLDKDGKPWIAVEGGGTYKDYEYLIVLNHMGHRCGYVAIPPGHKANNVGQRQNTFTKDYELDYFNLNIECHGGLTFGSNKHGLKRLLSTPCTDHWIGFDCGHLYDKSDLEALEKYYGEGYAENRKKYEHKFFDDVNSEIRSYRYAENECKKIIEQLI